jgi:hypothetical protein
MPGTRLPLRLPRVRGYELTLPAAQDLARSLMKEHGLSGWAFGWDRARCRYGCCNYERRRISLSVPLTLLDTEANVRDTLLHEIAHALVGPGHGHDFTWRRKARALGCKAEPLGPIPTLQARYIGACPHCGEQIHRDRRASYKLFHKPCMQKLGEVEAAVIQWRRAS